MEDLHDGASQPAYSDNVCARVRSLCCGPDHSQSARRHYGFGTYWEFNADKPVRSAIVIGQRADGWSAYFGDVGANVYAVDALTGRELWKTRVEDHPAARVTRSC
jgi:hypothetical protein